MAYRKFRYYYEAVLYYLNYKLQIMHWLCIDGAFNVTIFSVVDGTLIRHEDKMKWSDAKQSCQNQNMRLAVKPGDAQIMTLPRYGLWMLPSTRFGDAKLYMHIIHRQNPFHPDLLLVLTYKYSDKLPLISQWADAIVVALQCIPPVKSSSASC